jgi:hypothetical protein
MLKRPINHKFHGAVLSGQKTTTIRDTAWPVDVPIMLYSWSGPAYRSKQLDMAAVKVVGVWSVFITHNFDGSMYYHCGRESEVPLYVSEGFSSWAEMDEWFRPLIKPGQTQRKALMNIRKIENVRLVDELRKAANGRDEPRRSEA